MSVSNAGSPHGCRGTTAITCATVSNSSRASREASRQLRRHVSPYFDNSEKELTTDKSRILLIVQVKYGVNIYLLRITKGSRELFKNVLFHDALFDLL